MVELLYLVPLVQAFKIKTRRIVFTVANQPADNSLDKKQVPLELLLPHNGKFWNKRPRKCFLDNDNPAIVKSKVN